ncbi:MAG: hypothetical protein K0R90_436 [Oscillospiraceae bacterium]|nr:hypothetical protein [Oscillospiraceae bacterium]
MSEAVNYEGIGQDVLKNITRLGHNQNLGEKIDDLGVITLPTGVYGREELINMLGTLPSGLTFVDGGEMRKSFSKNQGQILSHKDQIACFVEKMVEEFKANQKDHKDFWVDIGKKFILIRYIAVRSENGEYLGAVEVTQNIKPIKRSKAQERLVI